MDKKIKLTITVNPETIKTLREWRDYTGIPVSAMIEQGIKLRVTELEKIYTAKPKGE